MQIINIDNKEQFNKFVGSQKHSQFLQSWQWGEFQECVGNKVLRLGIEDDGRLVFAISLIKKSLFFGMSYFYAPRIGVKYLSEEMLIFLFKEIKKIAKKEKCIFLRFEPRNKFLISNFQFPIFKTIAIQPSKTTILDLGKSGEEILKNMHQKTRYNIRLAERKGVKIVETQNFASGFENFWKLMSETVERDGFRLHSKGYYKTMLNFDKNFIRLFLVKYNNKIIAGNIVSFFGNTAAYMHGASANESRNVMAPYLLQWHCIKLAKELGYKYYDFYGIDEKKWPGVTKFKKGFGGKEMQYPGTFDFVFNKMRYSIYRMARRARRTF